MNNKTKYMTAFTINMIVISSCLLIPVIIEGINIGRNVQTYYANEKVILPGSYDVLKWEIKESERLYGEIRSYNATIDEYYEYDMGYLQVIFVIMRDNQFEEWYDEGAPKPNIINSSYYFNYAYLSINNLDFDLEDEYVLVFYNDNIDPITIRVDLTLIPWGHIIPTAVLGIPMIICFIGLIIKLIATNENIAKLEKSKKISGRSIMEIDNDAEPQPIIKGNKFCVSCGAPITPKDGHYCPNCGSSV